MGILQQYLPDFAKRTIKKIAYRLYFFTDSVFKGPIDKYDPQTLLIFKKYLGKTSNCIDIGAHHGHILREILAAAPRGTHFAFEPIPGLYKKLQKRFGKKVVLYNCALSDRKGTAEFNLVVDKPAISGLKKRTDYGPHPVSTFSVSTERLDDIVPPDVKIDLIKIDVEGAEMLVLKGAVELLRRNKPIVLFEFGSAAGDLYDTDPAVVYDLFTECGMEVSVIEYFLRRQTGFSREEFTGQYRKGYNYFFIAYNKDILKKS